MSWYDLRLAALVKSRGRAPLFVDDDRISDVFKVDASSRLIFAWNVSSRTSDAQVRLKLSACPFSYQPCLRGNKLAMLMTNYVRTAVIAATHAYVILRMLYTSKEVQKDRGLFTRKR